MDTVRNRKVLVALALLGSSAAAVVSCNSITGLNDYESIDCFGDCVDASIDNTVPDVIQGDSAKPDADAGPEADAPAPDADPDADADVSDVIVEVGPDVPWDVDLDAQAGLLDPKRRWARWKMPQVENPEAGVLLPGVMAASYTRKTGDGSHPVLSPDAVQDDVTLLWWDAKATAPLTFAEADAYCSEVPASGGFVWSLPTRIELVSLLDYSRTPAIAPGEFDDPVDNVYWTRSPKAGTADDVWIVNFSDGTVSTSKKTVGFGRARCVRIPE